ncbi:MAG TPA: aldo/keto reductase [Woeseiaceae bacterium]|nr:aldo/keto reductase [Woeseiaceae bacterium]
MTHSIKARTTLNNGSEMPWLGLGVYKLANGGEVEDAIRYALDIGYRSIDTASIYENEAGVGRALRDCGIPRDEIFLTTKLWNTDQRERRQLAAFEESLDRLGLDYVDLYLVHWPVADRFQETWPLMEEIYDSGRARAIGVSNFMQDHLEKLMDDCRIVPAVNQVEFHPHLVQPELLDFCERHEIRLEAWSPLMQGEVTDEPTIVALAKKYGKSPAQVVLRWDLQHGVVTIPKSGRPERIAENAGIFDFELAAGDMTLLDGLDQGRRLGPSPWQVDF